MSSSFAPSVIGTSTSDLDGFSMPGDFSYPNMQPRSYQPDAEDFGFDPAPKNSAYPPRFEHTYSPPDDTHFGEFDFNPVKGEDQSCSPIRPLKLDRMFAQSIPNANSAIARYGQMTPPRSNSESSIEKPADSKSTRPRRVNKSSPKEESAQPAASGRKRRNTRKNSTASMTGAEDDDKRKQSLEKNRLAAAKCRVNKKEKTEQLQRDSHDKAVQNAFLKEQVMRMKEEVQQMNALLLGHANCDGCKSPQDIQKHLSHLGNEYFSNYMQGLSSHDFSSFSNMSFEQAEMEHEHYFSPATDSSMNPPLPEFDREPEFDVRTPMLTD
ncbi:hypothetical protein LTR70_009246 [Exophiala xenobiotica]|uniref:BZIP domain-containing protein n=1 Tax=Lithohypha guttulata TaxID=1690604 RepID=A0ABR0K1K3_9EURO|nr:hypothetical protein LTR24_008054 [Lithohypha guttulata]KAK5310751.1 hypothetical protein LTR70_009246 [Exophiala xenobiotica]